MVSGRWNARAGVVVCSTASGPLCKRPAGFPKSFDINEIHMRFQCVITVSTVVYVRIDGSLGGNKLRRVELGKETKRNDPIVVDYVIVLGWTDRQQGVERILFSTHSSLTLLFSIFGHTCSIHCPYKSQHSFLLDESATSRAVTAGSWTRRSLLPGTASLRNLSYT